MFPGDTGIGRGRRGSLISLSAQCDRGDFSFSQQSGIRGALSEKEDVPPEIRGSEEDGEGPSSRSAPNVIGEISLFRSRAVSEELCQKKKMFPRRYGDRKKTERVPHLAQRPM